MMHCSHGCMEDGFVGVIDGHAIGPQKTKCSLVHLDPCKESEPKRHGTAHQDRVLISCPKTRELVANAFTLPDTPDLETESFSIPRGIEFDVKKKVEGVKKKKRTPVKVDL